MKRAFSGSFAVSATLAAVLISGSAFAGPSCGGREGEAALRTAALQQYLMVAALTCQRVPAYNGFVVAHQSELQQSDHALLRLFVGRNARTGDADYNAYKTWLANAASMRSLHDPQFCAIADAAFGAATERDKPLAQLVDERPVPLDISQACGQQTNAAPAESLQRQASLIAR